MPVATHEPRDVPHCVLFLIFFDRRISRGTPFFPSSSTIATTGLPEFCRNLWLRRITVEFLRLWKVRVFLNRGSLRFQSNGIFHKSSRFSIYLCLASVLLTFSIFHTLFHVRCVKNGLRIRPFYALCVRIKCTEFFTLHTLLAYSFRLQNVHPFMNFEWPRLWHFFSLPLARLALRSSVNRFGT